MDAKMCLLPLVVNWRHGNVDASGTVIERDGNLWLQSDVAWNIRTGGDSRAIVPNEVRGDSERGPVFMRGSVRRVAGSDLLRIADLRVGTDDPDELLVRAWATFEHSDKAGRHYHRDGAARSPRELLRIPPLESAPEMALLYASASIELTSSIPTELENFETQLDALRRLLTFATQQSTARLSLEVETLAGARVQVLGRTAVKPGKAGNLDYRDFPLRLGRADTQQAIERWWVMMDDLRPIPQLLTSIVSQPGYLESDFLLYATAVDRLSDEWTTEPGPLSPQQFQSFKAAAQDIGLPSTFFISNSPSFATRAQAFARLLPDDVWSAVKVDQESWLASLKRHRNLVAHSSEQKAAHRQFLTGPGLRALRDATAAIVTLVIAQHLGATGEALRFAADRQNYQRIARHSFQVLGFANDGVRALPSS